MESNLVLENSPAESLDPIPVLKIRPPKGWSSLGLREVWEYRELLYFLTWRDVKVRYKQTALGAAWAVIQPFFMMVVFSLFFGRLGGIPSDGVPYPVFAFCALLPWQLFAHAFVILLGMMAYYGIVPTAMVVTLPLFLLLALVTALGVGLWLSALNVQYRDVRYTIGFLTQFWLFATPVAYPSSIVPAQWRWLYGLNPMAGVVEGFRWALLGKTEGPGAMLAVSVAAVILIFVGGIYYFRRMERTFADVV